MLSKKESQAGRDIMKIQQNLPQQVDRWLRQARQADQTPIDRNPQVDQVHFKSYSLPQDEAGDRVSAAQAAFDSQGATRARLTVETKLDAFWGSQARVELQREGEWENVKVQFHHPRDPQLFDSTNTYRRNINSGEITDAQTIPGPPKGLELAKEILTTPANQALMGGAAAVGAVLAATMGGNAVGIAAGAAFVGGLAYLFCMQERAYGI